MRGLLVHAPNLQAVPLKQIYNAKRERIVRPDDGEIYLLLLREREQLGQIIRCEVDTLDRLRRFHRTQKKLSARRATVLACGISPKSKDARSFFPSLDKRLCK